MQTVNATVKPHFDHRKSLLPRGLTWLIDDRVEIRSSASDNDACSVSTFVTKHHLVALELEDGPQEQQVALLTR